MYLQDKFLFVLIDIISFSISNLKRLIPGEMIGAVEIQLQIWICIQKRHLNECKKISLKSHLGSCTQQLLIQLIELKNY